MDYLSTIRKPIDGDMDNFVELFKQSLTHGEGMLEQILKHIRERGGKRMRPMLVFLTATGNYLTALRQNSLENLNLLS